jgi:hypothetical protein
MMRNEYLERSATSTAHVAPCELGDDTLDAMVGVMDGACT